MILALKIVLVFCAIYLCSGNNGIQNRGKSFVVVFDVTSSMTQEIEALSIGIQQLMDDFTSRPDNPIDNYILVQFRDEEFEPNLIPIFNSNVYSEVKAELQTLKTREAPNVNVDCDESSYSALKRGIEAANYNSVIFLVTDAGTKQLDLLPEINNLIALKGVQIYFFVALEGCTSSKEDADEYADHYRGLAITSNGMLFEIKPDEINDIFTKYNELIKTNSTINDLVQGSEGRNTFNITIDKSMSEFAFTITADKPIIKLYDPNSILISDSQWQKLVDMPNIKIIKFMNPMPGIWKLEIEAETQLVGQISVVSALQFKYGFSVLEPVSMFETEPYPLQGKNTFLTVQPSNLSYVKDLEYVRLIVDSGSIIEHKLRRKPSFDGDIFITDPFTIPTEPFKVVLHGKDPSNDIIQRLVSTTITGNPLGKPEAAINPKISVYEDEPIYLICGIFSAVNVTMSWSRVGANSKLKSLNSKQSNILNYTIDSASVSDAGEYICSAKNSAGSSESKSIVEVKRIDITVNVDQTAITVRAGEPFIILKCEVQPNMSSIETAWLFNGNSNLPQSSEVNGTNLILHNIKPNFNGTYTCRGRKGAREQSADIELNVQYPPKILNIIDSSTRNASIDLNKPIQIYDKRQMNIICSNEGNPKPIVKWIRQTGQIVSNTSSLFINGSDISQTGDYRCQIETNLGKDEQKLSVVVIILPTLLPVVERTRNVKLGDSYKLECPLEVVPNNHINITWYHNETLLNHNEYLMWPTVGHSTNGQYKCTAENKAGKVETTITINVTYEPTILKITKSDDLGILDLDSSVHEIEIFNTTQLTLNCIANGNPNPVVNWIKNRNIISVGNLLTINETNSGFSGLFECSAQNYLNTASRIVSLKEIKKPTLKSAYQSVYNLTENKPFTLKCPVNSGEYTMTWTINGQAVDNFTQNDGSLSINSVAAIDMKGDVVCAASNKAGTVQAKLTFDVLRAPYNLTISPKSTISVMENKTLHIKCSAHGYPIPDIVWAKNNQHYLIGNTIRFSSLISNDTANYTCMATNVLGNRTETIEVIVEFPPRLKRTANLNHIAGNTSVTILKLEKQPIVPKEYYEANYTTIVQFNAHDNISLDCPIIGHPAPVIKWFKNNHNLGWNSEVLRFGNIKISDSGIYKCLGSNLHGGFDIVFLLNAKAQIVDPTKSFEIVDQGIHYILCANQGAASTNLWLHQNHTVVINSPLLTINGTDTTQSGVYHCQSESDSGTKNQSLHIDIAIHPKALVSYNTRYEVKLGYGIVLECPLEVVTRNKWNISWYHNGTLIYQNSIMDSTYNIRSVDHKSNGIYKCMIVNNAGSIDIEMILDVVYEPSILSIERIDNSGTSNLDSNQNSLEIYNTSTLALVCHANGNPKPKTIWKKNGLEVSTNHKLNLDTKHGKASGVYECYTKNKISSAKRIVTISVIVKPNAMPNYPKLVNLTENTQFSMACPMEAGDFNVNWFIKQTSIDSYKQPDGSIQINNVTPLFKGDIVCIASNKAGSTKATFKFDVLRAPFDTVISSKVNQIVPLSSNSYKTTIKSSDRMNITCNGNGNPTPLVFWIKNNRQYSIGNSISIISINSTDQGVYMCVVKNDLGNQTKTLEVVVHFRPQLLHITDLVNGPITKVDISFVLKHTNIAQTYFDANYQRSVEFKVGDQIYFDCKMSGNPVPQITWFKDGAQLNERNQEIRKVRVTSNDAGIYKCIGTNYLGSIQILFYVNDAANRVDYTQPIEIYGRNVKHLVCAFSGVTTPVKWVNQNGQLSANTPLLAIDGNSEAGEYICQIGSRNQSIKVDVIVEPKLIVSYQREYKINLGASFSLYCPLVPMPDNQVTIKWYHNNTDLQRDGDVNTPLSFPIVELNNNGNYKCVATNKAGSVEAEILLDVLYAPNILKIDRLDDLGPSVISLNDSFIEVYNITTLKLTCHTNGNPKPTTIWRKEGINFTATNVLELNTVTQFDDSYECYVQNMIGTVTKIIKMKHIKRPKPLSSYSEKVELILNSQFTMTCPIEIGDYNVTWSLNDTIIDKYKQANQSIIIKSVKRDMKGEVICVATNKAGSATAVFNFELVRKPHSISIIQSDRIKPNAGPYEHFITIDQNMSMNITCQAKGNPKPSYYWKKNGEYLLGDAILNLTAVTLNDRANYTCVALNKLGEISETYKLVVNIPPNFDTGLNFKRITKRNTLTNFKLSVLDFVKVPDEYFNASVEKEIQVNETQSFVLNCTAPGNPTPIVKWYKNSTLLDGATESTISYTNATVKDSGIYKCIVSNIVGEKSALFYVNVRKNMEFVSPTSPQNNYHLGNRISIACCVSGNPIPTIIVNGRNSRSQTNNAKIKKALQTNNYLQQHNTTFYIKGGTIIKAEDIESESQYGILTFELENGEIIATLNHIIERATNDHSDTFNCSIHYEPRNKIYRQFQIVVTVEPYIKPTKQIHFIQEGLQNQLIECPIYGNPTPTIEWYHGHKKMQTDLNFEPIGHNLKIRNPINKNSGAYSCQAKNSNVQFKFILRMFLKKTDLTNQDIIINNTKTITILKDDTIPLTCYWGSNIAWFESVEDNFKQQIYHLTSQDVYSIVGDFDRKLLCSKISAPTNAEFIYVTVVEKPQIVSVPVEFQMKLDDNFRLTCKASGHPGPTIRWQKFISNQWINISQLSDYNTAGTTLLKARTSFSDESKYLCEAENYLGKDTKTFTVKVLNDSHYYDEAKDWTKCTKTCGEGVQQKTRTCIHSSCNYTMETITQSCNIMKCPIDGGWSDWVSGPCSRPCLRNFNDVSEIKKVRQCNAPSPQFGGKICPGLSSKINKCYVPVCETGSENYTYQNCKLKQKHKCCPDNYKHMENPKRCINNDPCARKGKDAVCRTDTQICIKSDNTADEYKCECKVGFKQSSGRQIINCIDIDECNQNPYPCGNQKCDNTLGSFKCYN